MMKTLEDYINWLRENGHHQEAEYYRREVFKVFSKFLHLTDDEIRTMPANRVVENLQMINDILSEEVARLQGNKEWDVNLIE